MINLPQYDLNTWLQELKPYQKDDIDILLQMNHHNPEIVAEICLSANGASNTVKFGGVVVQESTFFNNFKAEIKNFICGDSKYDYYYEQLKKCIEPNRYKTTLITSICMAIHGILGVSAAVIYPAVILLLSSIAAIGINAYCGINQTKI